MLLCVQFLQVDFPESIRNGRFAVQPHVDQELDDSKLFLYIMKMKCTCIKETSL